MFIDSNYSKNQSESAPLQEDAIRAFNAFGKMIDNTRETLSVLEAERDNLRSNLRSGKNVQESFEYGLSRSAALASNLLSITNNASIALLDGQYNRFWADDRRAPDWCFRGVIKDNRLMLKLPPLPVAPYRSSLRTSPSCRALRLPQLDVMLGKLPLLDIKPEDSLLLFVLHVIPQDYNVRKTPDFDNYDIKQTIDTILEPYGGDGPFCYALLNCTQRAGLLASGTYAMLSINQGDIPFHEMIAQLAEEFPFESFAAHEPEFSSLRMELAVPPKPFVPEVNDNAAIFQQVPLRPVRKTRIKKANGKSV